LKPALFRLALAVLTGAGWTAHAASAPPPHREAPTDREIAQGYRSQVVIVKPRAHRGAPHDADEQREGMRVRRRWDRFGGLRVLDLPAGESVESAIRRLRASGRYEYVQADSLRRTLATPNDPNFNRQWPLFNNGANNGIAGADIKAPAGWDVRTDAAEIIVAVIDTGVRLDHPDLVANLWRNPLEIPGNGRDDDGNGYVDDVHGINAINGTGTPTDDTGHGTHVAGIIGAVGNNGLGISGVAWRVRIMPLKFLGGIAGRGSTSDAIECIDYAIRQGAHIINASYGIEVGPVPFFDPAEFDAVRQARDAGIIFVAAAGNDGANLDLLAHYPASYRLENVIAVGNSANRDEPSAASNFGSGSVELFAPGTEVYSLSNNPASPYATLSGTSMAAPHVTGALALVKAQFPNDNYRQLINRVLRSVDPVPALIGRAQTGGRLNLDRALRSTTNRPFNDGFATRSRIRGENLAIRTDNNGATTEAEPPIAGVAAGSTLWWEWTAPVNGLVRISTAGSAYDTVVGVFTGTALNALAPVAANDDDTDRATSRLEFSAQAGATYQIVVGSKGGTSGLTLMDIGSIPANDSFASAQTISGRSAVVTATNAQATLETGEPQILGQAGGKSLWYRWTAPASGRFQFGASSDGFDPLLAVYTGTAINALTLVGASDDADAESGGVSNYSGALVTVNATAGTTYSIQLEGTARNGLLPPTAPFTLTVNDSVWQGIAGGNLTSAPTVGPDGSVYVGSSDGFFHAFTANGTRRWAAINLAGALLDTSSAALAPNGTIYFGGGPTGFRANSSRLYAYNSATGARKWEIIVGTGLNANNAVALATDGTIYVHSDEGRLFAYTDHGTNVTQKWSTVVPGNSYASAVVGPDGTVYIGSDDNTSSLPIHRFFALNPVNGTVKWSFVADNPIYTAPAIDSAGNLYFGTLTSGRLYSLTSAGTQRWIYRGATLGTSSSPALSPGGGTVYFAGYDGVLHAVDTATGEARWTFKLGDEVRASSPAVDANGVIYIGVYDGLVYAVNPNGTLRRTWATGGIVRSSPALADGKLYVGSNDNRLYVFDVGAAAASPWSQYRQNPQRTGQARLDVLRIVSAPQTQVAALGAPLTLAVVATGEGTLRYEWRKDGAVIAGATGPALSIGEVTTATAGAYNVTVSDALGSVTSAPATITVEALRRGRLTNLSVRTTAGNNDQVLTVGFVLGGTPGKEILLRAIGPTLADFGVANTLADPRLQLYSASSALLSANDNWATDTLPVTSGGTTATAMAGAFSVAGAFALRADSLDAALLRTLTAGSYTAQISGATGTGIALAELYDPTPADGARLVNVSARAQVGTGGGILIAGFSISGNVPKRVLIRAVGPSLGAFGVTGVLANPRLDLYRGSTLRQSNDDWSGQAALTAAFTQVGAFNFLSATSLDAALLVDLEPGSYTAQVSGAASATGIALVEIYEVP
jgi:subtilisin family serine protease/outer membrane protein assembly factor BamB